MIGVESAAFDFGAVDDAGGRQAGGHGVDPSVRGERASCGSVGLILGCSMNNVQLKILMLLITHRLSITGAVPAP